VNILHLSQTDIKYDSRILKEINTISQIRGIDNIYGIGVRLQENTTLTENLKSNIHIESVTIGFKKLKYLPKIIIHIFVTLEIFFKMFYKSLKVKPKIIHCHDTPVLPLGVIVKLFTGAKLIYDAHELESDRNGLSKTLGKMTLFVERLLWRYIDALIIVSPSIDKWYQNNVGHKYSEIILNSPVLEKSIKDTNKSYLREYFSIPKNSRIFLYIGILGPGRGIELISSVFKKYELNSSLIFLGYGELSNTLKILSKESKNIYVHDAVAHEKVVSVAQSADVGLCLIENVSLSDYYCLPNKLFEYSFAQIPILASDFPDISTVIKQYNIGKSTNLDEDSIYQAIKEFEENEALPIVNSDNLYPLSWGAQEEKLIRLYNRVIQGES